MQYRITSVTDLTSNVIAGAPVKAYVVSGGIGEWWELR